MMNKTPANAWLIDQHTGQSLQLWLPETRIGRQTSENDIVLGDPSVSRHHALIRFQAGAFILLDVGANVPILLNKRPVQGPTSLYHHDIIRLGAGDFQFVQGT